MRLRVTSTALNASTYAGRCVASVRRQTYRDWTHDYIDAASDDDTWAFALDEARHPHAPRGLFEDDPQGVTWRDDTRRFTVRRCHERRSVFENLFPLWRSFDPEDVIVWLDGDDQLATDYALERIAHEHKAGAWATYGQFLWQDGSLGFAAPCGDHPRREPWRATHLKTFRAGLVQQMRPSDWEGQTLCLDRIVMLACLEMAGPARSRFIPEVLAIYNSQHAWYRTASEEDLARERAALERVHALPPYACLDALTRRAA